MSNGVTRSGLLAAQIETTVDIAAPPERVWAVLTDFARYPEWNPFIPRIDGRPEVGARLTVRIVPPGGRPMTFRPYVLTAEPGRELRWRGRLFVPGLFDGEHAFRLMALNRGGVRFRQEERFRGLLLPLFAGNGLERTRRGFEEMNAALKRRAEQEGPGRDGPKPGGGRGGKRRSGRRR